MPTTAPLSKPIKLPERLSAVLLLVGMLAGCSLAPAYQAPALPVSNNLHGGPETGAPSTMTNAVEALTEEEKQLLIGLDSSPQLPRLVDQALNYNRDLRLALLRVEQARAQYGISRADRWPTVALGLQRNRQHLHDKVADERYGQDIAVASVGVSDFELDFFGRVRSLADAAQHDYLATHYGALAARKALIVEVARLYLQERLQAGVQADTRSISDDQNRLLSMLVGQQKEGLVAQDTVDTQSMEVHRATQQVQDASADHERALQALSWVTGYQVASTTQATQIPAIDLGTPPWLVELPSQRLLQRLDVRQSEEALRAANANIGAARAAFFPSITLSTGTGIASPHLSSLFSSGSGAWLFTPQLNLPLFDGGRNQANLDLATARQQSAVAQYEKTVQDAFREIADLLSQRQQALANATTQIDLAALTALKAKRLDQQIAAGAAARSEHPTAAIRLAESAIELRKATYQLLFNRLALYRALSGAPLFSSAERVSP
ncbi:Efflux transport system, outer membrane factor (OMF) lipoprotein [Pseudomonas sp. R1-43-08]|uniref:efflux transporter outer membrane subunit n=1 Tax=Pseudomonas sp. R1-43-08 TaxID=1173270 RepID=UPI000F56E92A|nr:efflux transporter outer membrane subunit [Pseudomonas sp. R1-43-08]AZF43361.1 Efflux transport system, outer membrane factor (OMF) lipoprotein [Pseudomonas sp. R1-43-08]